MAKKREAVNHPAHYGGDVPHEIWKCLEAWGLTKDSYRWNAVKYIARCDLKNDPVEDLRKAIWYIEKAIAKREGKLDAIVRGVYTDQRPLSAKTLERIKKLVAAKYGRKKMSLKDWIKVAEERRGHASR